MQEIIKTPIDGLKILKPLIHKDSRGFFSNLLIKKYLTVL